MLYQLSYARMRKLGACASRSVADARPGRANFQHGITHDRTSKSPQSIKNNPAFQIGFLLVPNTCQLIPVEKFFLLFRSPSRFEDEPVLSLSFETNTFLSPCLKMNRHSSPRFESLKFQKLKSGAGCSLE